MKKLIYILGVIFLAIVVILNFVMTAKLDIEERITIGYNHLWYNILLILLGVGIYCLINKVNEKLYQNDTKKKNTIKKSLFVVGLLSYTIFNIIWVIKTNPSVVGDSVHVCNLAQVFYRKDETQLLSNLTYAGISLKEYMQAYPQQISLAFVFSLVFRIIHFDVMELLRALNIMGNIAIVVALYKIGKQLSKRYKMNKVLLLTIILTFIALPMLATFIYGDIPSIALCLFSVYFMMKYRETKQKRYVVGASILTMIAYMMRMNCLIFVIATVMYLCFILWQEARENGWKKNVLSVTMIVLYIIISIFPATLVKNYYLAKYDLDKKEAYPSISYLLMGMESSSRGNGWYNEEIAEKALKNRSGVKEEYQEKIKERLIYFSKNIGEAFQFYTNKIASMWTETTYSMAMNNHIEENEIIRGIAFYQKVLCIIICGSTFIVLLQNRKNLSLDMIFLITIFIGGFTFHLLWEAKSRYILPYMLVLIPMAAIQIQQFKTKKKEVLEEEKKEVLEQKSK